MHSNVKFCVAQIIPSIDRFVGNFVYPRLKGFVLEESNYSPTTGKLPPWPIKLPTARPPSSYSKSSNKRKRELLHIIAC
jgi:hypothetical protein